MKKLFILAALVGVVALSSCAGNGSKTNATEAGQKVDSLVENAKEAVGNTADSVKTDVKNTADSLKAKADSLTNGK